MVTPNTSKAAAAVRAPFRLRAVPRAVRQLRDATIAAVGLSHALLVPALAAPNGAEVVHGNADIVRNGSTTTVHNSAGAVINWQDFSIASDEIARFVQSGADSAVLNRVVGAALTDIQGRLESNGRVFLINPNGLVIGDGAVVDTAGFVGSTLDITDEDFLAGNLRFSGDGQSRVVNDGLVVARHGDVLLVAPLVENGGIIRADNGDVLLAAGQSVTVQDMNNPLLTFTVEAAGTAVNLGELVAAGAVRAFAGSLTHSGHIEAGSVSLGASGEVILNPGSSVSASGADGGDIRIDGGDAGTVWLNGLVAADGSSGRGGAVQVTGQRVGVTGSVSADGGSGGGSIEIGGSQRGEGPLPNSERTYIGAEAVVSASATVDGDGGTVITFGSDLGRFHGQLAARGAGEGDGGFVETSSHGQFALTATPDIGAERGQGGEWLIDPPGIDIVADGTGTANDRVTATDPFRIDGAEGTPATLEVGLLLDALTTTPDGTTITIETVDDQVGGGTVFGSDIRIQTAIDYDGTGSNTLIFRANNDIEINNAILDGNGGDDSLSLQFIAENGTTAFKADVDAGAAGTITVVDGTQSFDDYRFDADLSIAAGGGFIANGSGTMGSNTVTLNTNATLHDFNLGTTGAVLQVGDGFTVTLDTDFLARNGTTLAGTGSGTGRFLVPGTSAGVRFALGNTTPLVIDNVTFENQSTNGRMTLGEALAGNVSLANGATLLNSAGASFQINNNIFILTDGSATRLVNAGSLDFDFGTMSVASQLDNSGTLLVNEADVTLSGGGSNTGTIDFATSFGSASLIFDGADGSVFTSDPGAILDGAEGSIVVNNGIAQFDGAFSGLLAIDINGGQLDLLATSAQANNVSLLGGTLSIGGGATLSAEGFTNLSGGTLAGAGELVIPLAGGDLGMDLTGGGVTLDGGTLRVQTTGTQSQITSDGVGTLSFSNGGTLVVDSGAQLTVLDDALFTNGEGSGTLQVDGFLQVEGALQVDAPVAVSAGATVNVALAFGGALELTGGGTLGGTFADGGEGGLTTVSGGSLAVQDGARFDNLEHTGGTLQVDAGASFSFGTYGLTGGTLAGGGTGSATSLTWTSGTIAGDTASDSLTVANAINFGAGTTTLDRLLVANGGAIFTTGTLQLDDNGELNLPVATNIGDTASITSIGAGTGKVHFAGGSSSATDNFNASAKVSAGNVNFGNATTFRTLELLGGQADVSGSATINDAFIWDNGDLVGEGGTTVLQEGALATLGTTAGRSLSGTTLVIDGSLSTTGAFTLSFANEANLDISSTGSVAINSDMAFAGSPNERISNDGQFDVSVSLFSQVAFDNSGQVDVAAGRFLRLDGDGQHSGGFGVGTDGLLLFTDGAGDSHTFLDGSVVAGLGQARLSGAANIVGTTTGTLWDSNLNLGSQTIGGTGLLTVTGTVDFFGTNSFAGDLVIDGGSLEPDLDSEFSNGSLTLGSLSVVGGTLDFDTGAVTFDTTLNTTTGMVLDGTDSLFASTGDGALHTINSDLQVLNGSSVQVTGVTLAINPASSAELLLQDSTLTVAPGGALTATTDGLITIDNSTLTMEEAAPFSISALSDVIATLRIINGGQLSLTNDGPDTEGLLLNNAVLVLDTGSLIGSGNGNADIDFGGNPLQIVGDGDALLSGLSLGGDVEDIFLEGGTLTIDQSALSVSSLTVGSVATLLLTGGSDLDVGLLNNDGTVQLDAEEELDIFGGEGSGTFEVGDAASLLFGAETYTFFGGSSLTGSGQVLLDSAIVDGNLSLTGNLAVKSNNAFLSGFGSIFVATGWYISGNSSIDNVFVQVGDGGMLDVGGTSGTTVMMDSVSIDAGGELNLLTTNEVDTPVFLGIRFLDNFGTINITDGAAGGTRILQGRLFNAGTMNVLTDATIDGAEGSAVGNFGTLSVADGVTASLSGEGMVSLEMDGDIALGSGAVLALTGDFSWLDGAISGPGTLQVGGDTLLGVPQDTNRNSQAEEIIELPPPGDTITLDGFSLADGATLTTGVLDLNDNSLDAAGNIEADQLLLSDNAVLTLSAGTATVADLSNNGAAEIGAGGLLAITGGSGVGSFDTASGGQTTFSGYTFGTGASLAGAGQTVLFDALIDNELNVTGNLLLSSATLTGSGSISLAGALTIGTGTGSPTTNQLAGIDVIGAAGSSIQLANAIISVGEITTQGAMDLQGTNLLTAAELTVSGELVATAGSNSTLTIGAGMITTTLGGDVTLGDAAQVAFTGGLKWTGATMSGPGSVTTAGNLALLGDSMSLSGTTLQAGGTGQIGSDTTLTLLDGNLGADGGFTVNGMLAGNGTINGSLANAGDLAPGLSPGAISINGDFSQTATGTLIIDLDGSAPFDPGVDHDLLAVGGNASLGGTLRFVQLEGFGGISTSDGESFTPLTFASASGNFDSQEFVGDPNLAFTGTIGPNGFVVAVNDTSIVPPPPPPPEPEPEPQPEPEPPLGPSDFIDKDPSQDPLETTQEIAQLTEDQHELEGCDNTDADEPEKVDENLHGVGCFGM